AYRLQLQAPSMCLFATHPAAENWFQYRGADAGAECRTVLGAVDLGSPPNRRCTITSLATALSFQRAGVNCQASGACAATPAMGPLESGSTRFTFPDSSRMILRLTGLRKATFPPVPRGTRNASSCRGLGGTNSLPSSSSNRCSRRKPGNFCKTRCTAGGRTGSYVIVAVSYSLPAGRSAAASIGACVKTGGGARASMGGRSENTGLGPGAGG